MVLQIPPTPADLTVPCGGDHATNQVAAVERFVGAVMAPGGQVVRINTANVGRPAGRGMDVAMGLVTSDACFAVEVRPGLLAADFDSDDPGPAEQFVEAVRTAGLRPVMLSSGGGVGRRHVWVRTDDPVWARLAAELGAEVRRVIRPPLVRHRSGSAPILLNCTSAQALEALRPTVEEPGVERHGHRPAVSPVAIKPAALTGTRIALPDPARFESDSERVMSAARRMSNAGGSVEDLIAQFTATAYGPWLGRRSKNGDRRTDRWLRRYVWPALLRPLGAPAPVAVDIAGHLLHLEQRANGLLKGRPADTPRRLLEVLIGLARSHSTLTVGLSVRQAVEAGGMAKNTATKGFKRLQELGLISRVTLGKGGYSGGPAVASEWLLLPESHEGRTLRTPPMGPSVPSHTRTPLPQHDVLSGAGLGHPTLETYSLVCTLGQVHFDDLLIHLGEHTTDRRTLSRRSRNLVTRIDRLVSAGLVTCSDGFVEAVVDPDLDLAAGIRNGVTHWEVPGRIERHARHHAAERLAFLEHRVALARRAHAGHLRVKSQPAAAVAPNPPPTSPTCTVGCSYEQASCRYAVVRCPRVPPATPSRVRHLSEVRCRGPPLVRYRGAGRSRGLSRRTCCGLRSTRRIVAATPA